MEEQRWVAGFTRVVPDLKILSVIVPGSNSSSSNQDVLVSSMTDYGLNDRDCFPSEDLENIFFATASEPVLCPTQPPIQLRPVVKRVEREADH